MEVGVLLVLADPLPVELTTDLASFPSGAPHDDADQDHEGKGNSQSGTQYPHPEPEPFTVLEALKEVLNGRAQKGHARFSTPGDHDLSPPRPDHTTPEWRGMSAALGDRSTSTQ
jgi:hypothetical protein